MWPCRTLFQYEWVRPARKAAQNQFCPPAPAAEAKPTDSPLKSLPFAKLTLKQATLRPKTVLKYYINTALFAKTSFRPNNN
jgi:hypothetical protein